MAKSQAEIDMAVEEQIRQLRSEKNYKVFWPRQFTELADLASVLRSLADLARAGRVSVTAIARCPDGHIVWEGAPDRTQDAVGRTCDECEQRVTMEGGWDLKFRITEEWDRVISKKKPWWQSLVDRLLHRRRQVTPTPSSSGSSPRSLRTTAPQSTVSASGSHRL